MPLRDASFRQTVAAGASGLVLIAALDGCDAPLTAMDLYGEWATGDVDGATYELTLASRDDGTHPELAGVTDVYLWRGHPTGLPANYAQLGTYRMDEDRMVRTLLAADGPWPEGMVVTDVVADWSRDSFTLIDGSHVLPFQRQPAAR